MISINEDINYRHSQTPSVCQYNHQSLILFSSSCSQGGLSASKNIGNPNLTFTSCPNPKSKFNIFKNHISTTIVGKLKLFAPLYWSLIVKKYLQKFDANLTLTSCPNWKSKFNISKNHISTTARGRFTIIAPLYRSLIVKKYLQRVDPNLTVTACPNRKSKFNI